MASTKFPLFETLLNESSTVTQLTKEQMKQFFENMKALDTEGLEISFALLRYYSVVIEGESTANTPFKSKIYRNVYKIDMDLIPQKLQIMLAIFARKHIQKIRDEQERLALVESIAIT